MSSNSYPPVTLPGTEVRLLHSATVNQEYKLFVALPQGYEATEDRYPVLYFSDANWFFSAVSMLGMLGIPPMIMVGIGYPTDDFVDIFRLRARDFTPTQSPTDEATVQQLFQKPIESGGGGKYLAFIRDELFTFIDAEYLTDPAERTFFGYSYGGTFGLYTLFEQPDTFQRYIIGAPTLVYDQGICFQYEENYASSQNDLSAKL
jgi:predicted alpha/beta superfamily hydrolase